MIIGRRAYRRHLPHYQSDHRTYFITFVTCGRWILPPAARDLVMAHIQFDHLRKLSIRIGLVMPEHVHLIGSPLWNGQGEVFSPAEILQGIKGASARSVNRLLHRLGPVWQQESFDHEIRHDESLNAKIEYVANNPVRRGLVEKASDYPGCGFQATKRRAGSPARPRGAA